MNLFLKILSEKVDSWLKIYIFNSEGTHTINGRKAFNIFFKKVFLVIVSRAILKNKQMIVTSVCNSENEW